MPFVKNSIIIIMKIQRRICVRRKVRVTFPKLVQEVLQIDKEYFGMKGETLFNLKIGRATCRERVSSPV